MTKTIALVILWFVLAISVVGAIHNADDCSKSFLLYLAFMAWLGGLVTDRLIDAFVKYRDRKQY